MKRVNVQSISKTHKKKTNKKKNCCDKCCFLFHEYRGFKIKNYEESKHMK